MCSSQRSQAFELATTTERYKWWRLYSTEEISINIPQENLLKLNKERMQNFCHALKLNLRSRHSASVSNCSINRLLEPKIVINFLQQRILCLILHASEKQRIIAGKKTDVIVYVPIITYKYAGAKLKRAVQKGYYLDFSRRGKAE